MNAYRAKRLTLGYTQAELAALLGVSRETIIRREQSDPQHVSREAWLALESVPPKPKAP